MNKLVFAAAMLCNVCYADDHPVYLVCTPDAGQQARYPMGYLIDRAQHQLVMLPPSPLPGFEPAPMPLEETDNELAARIFADGKVVLSVVINKYTLRVTAFNIAGALSHETTWVGQCVIQQKKI